MVGGSFAVVSAVGVGVVGVGLFGGIGSCIWCGSGIGLVELGIVMEWGIGNSVNAFLLLPLWNRYL